VTRPNFTSPPGDCRRSKQCN